LLLRERKMKMPVLSHQLHQLLKISKSKARRKMDKVKMLQLKSTPMKTLKKKALEMVNQKLILMMLLKFCKISTEEEKKSSTTKILSETLQ